MLCTLPLQSLVAGSTPWSSASAPGTAGRPAPLLAEPAADQVSLGSLREAEVIDALRRCQPDTLTPIEAMSLLYELKQKLS